MAGAAWSYRVRAGGNLQGLARKRAAMGYLAATLADLRPPAAAPDPDPALWSMAQAAQWLIAAPRGFAGQRRCMVAALHARLTPLGEKLGAAPVARALDAMATVPRERFVCPMIEELAYLPMAPDIGLDQVISHPLLAAAADPQGGRVLDIGTGSGYQAAVLAEMAAHVTSVEILDGHAREARRRLDALGYRHVEVMRGDAGAAGRFAPESYDAIVVAAASASVPRAWLRALRIGGRLAMPLRTRAGAEWITLVERRGPADFRRMALWRSRFVPLTGSAAAHSAGR